jgi:hypothetical protein
MSRTTDARPVERSVVGPVDDQSLELWSMATGSGPDDGWRRIGR